ncbi:hypothetical protein POF50_033770 [Streptomyces sp. SL13]|uniref:Terpene synthase n=1 Tax=Streptantibioticus silvisoli TaxID=2705255 RepID=A0AA90H9D0_9ACTN|nr:hypothetical protein [Streptantibioticus silvisoli]MDI5967102.1 hypothetical protein [Streptantibioticus silvisoli]MDI5974256.1 hypothetical protein [Streptantibioticus silvisoli]
MRDDAGPLVVPELHCPVPPVVSPHARRLDRAVAAWATANGLCPTPGLRHRITHARFGTLAARTCPDATVERMELHAQWLALALFYDEAFFRPHREGLPDATGRASAAADAAMATVSALVPGGMPGGLPRGEADRRRYRLDVLSDLLNRTGTMARLEQYSRLGTALTLWLSRQVREEPAPPGPTAATPCLIMAEIASDCPITGDELAGDCLRRLTALATERAEWCLRVHTAARRRSVDELVPALPPLLRQGAEHHPQRALDRAARLHDESACTYHRLERSLTPLATPSVLAYLTLLRGWLRAQYDWSRPAAIMPGPLIVLPSARPFTTARLTAPVGGVAL